MRRAPLLIALIAAGCVTVAAVLPGLMPLHRSYLQDNMNGNQQSITNLGTLIASNVVASNITATATNVTFSRASLPGGPWPELSVWDFGAVPDGITDCTDAFKDCIETNGAGKSVFIPAGLYALSQSIYLPENCRVIGANMVNMQEADYLTDILPYADLRRGSVLTALPGFSGPGVLVTESWRSGDYWHGSSIEELTIMCDKQVDFGICIGASGEQATIRRVHVTEARASAYWIAGIQATLQIENCDAWASGDYAVRLTDGTNNALDSFIGGGLIKIHGMSGDVNTNGSFFENCRMSVILDGLKIERPYYNTNIFLITTNAFEGTTGGSLYGNIGPFWNVRGMSLDGQAVAPYYNQNIFKIEGTNGNSVRIELETPVIYGPTNVVSDWSVAGAPYLPVSQGGGVSYTYSSHSGIFEAHASGGGFLMKGPLILYPLASVSTSPYGATLWWSNGFGFYLRGTNGVDKQLTSFP